MFPMADDEVNTTDPPAQNVVGPPAPIVGVGSVAFALTVVPALTALEQPEAVTITVYAPEAFAV